MSPHPVQPTPADWTPPARYARCRVLETLRIPLEVGGDVYRTVTLLATPCGEIRAVDHVTKEEVCTT